MERRTLNGPAATHPCVEVLFGDAPETVRGIEQDFALLDEGRAASHAWTTTQTAVVLGRSRDLSFEVAMDECARRGVAILRRTSGGGTVVLGPGTVQYAFVLPHRHTPTRQWAASVEPPALEAVQRACNRAVAALLAECGHRAPIETDGSGDLRVGDRKVGGLALRRRRDATLLHGTLLTSSADLDLIAAVLRHPAREPAWRGGRPHADFLATLDPFDVAAFVRALPRTNVTI